MKSRFLEKLIERMDRIDPESLQAHFLRLASESGLLETIFQSIQEGIVVVDALGVLRYANRSAEEMLGFSAESALGRPISRYLKGIDWDRILDMDSSEWSKLISSEIEINYPKHRFVSFYFVPLATGKEDEHEGVVMMLRDVTSDREEEADMVETERLSAVKLLAAGVAHEIGNPLNALTIHLQLLLRDIEQIKDSAGDGNITCPKERIQSLKELVEVARNEVSRLDMIITQFLKAIRPTKPEFAPARIEEVVEETLSLLKAEIENRGILVEVIHHHAIPIVRMDRNQIKQAFFNVIKNALQAMPAGGSLLIETSVTERSVLVVFRDTGDGIDPAELGRIFEPYRTTRESGHGLGLMVVQRIVQDHGGRIEIESKVNAGTAFSIILPIAERRLRFLPRKKERARLQPYSEGGEGDNA